MKRWILLVGIIVGIVILGIVTVVPVNQSNSKDMEDSQISTDRPLIEQNSQEIEQDTQMVEVSQEEESEVSEEPKEPEKPEKPEEPEESETPKEPEKPEESEKPEPEVSEDENWLLCDFLENALKPVGNTMYIWGGGWNEEDTGAGVGSTYIGLYPKWKEFMNKQDANYDYKQHRYELENGLDCSGFVGWTIYNTFEEENGKEGYVTNAKKMAVYFANKGWGHLVENPKQFLPGDIVSMASHVWICLGTCADGSVLLVHASPPGVSVCGTKGIAAELAKEYMLSQHADWQKKYPKREVPNSYIENVTLFRWTKGTMADAEEIQSLTGEEMIKYMLEWE